MPEQAYVDGTMEVCEFNQVDLLCDVFIWACERSCHSYLAITQTLAEPDPLRIRVARYRLKLSEFQAWKTHLEQQSP